MRGPHRPPAGTGAEQSDRPWRAFAHPAFLSAVAVLALNDAVLKPRFASWWTGKLSDLAGVFVVAVVLGIATRRPWASEVLTAAGFAAIKLSPVAAGLAAPLLGGVTLQDRTDLLALVALVPAHHFVSRQVDPIADGRPWQVPLAAAAISLTVLSVSATSCGDDSPGVQAIELEDDGSLLAIANRTEEYGPTTSSDLYRSTDAGETWDLVSLDVDEPEPEGEQVSADQACTEDRGCFRVSNTAGGPVGAVEHEVDGRWEVASTLSAEQVRRIDLRRGFTSCGDDLGEAEDGPFSSVAVVDGPGGEHVLVTMGTEGVLRLAPDSDEWERVGVGFFEPTSTSGPSWLDRLGWAPIVVTGLLAAGLLIWMVVRWRDRSTGTALALLVTVLGGGALILLSIVLVSFLDVDYAVRGPVLAALSVVLVVVAVLLARRPAGRDRRSEPAQPGPF